MSNPFSWADFSQGSPDAVKDPIFSEPWEADTFAMLVALEKQGLFSWSEWGDALGAEIKAKSSVSDTGADYYRYVLTALENILAKKEIVPDGLLKQYQAGWANVAERTPHGQPLELTEDDLNRHR
jgi:nitrile hydratase accessory protein